MQGIRWHPPGGRPPCGHFLQWAHHFCAAHAPEAPLAALRDPRHLPVQRDAWQAPPYAGGAHLECESYHRWQLTACRLDVPHVRQCHLVREPGLRALAGECGAPSFGSKDCRSANTFVKKSAWHTSGGHLHVSTFMGHPVRPVCTAVPRPHSASLSCRAHKSALASLMMYYCHSGVCQSAVAPASFSSTAQTVSWALCAAGSPGVL